MKSRVQELIQIGDQLFTAKAKLNYLHQAYAEQFYPIRADFTRETRAISEEFASYLMTGRPVLAHRELSNAIGAILRPRNMDWFSATTGDESIDNDKASKIWLEAAAKAQSRAMYDQFSQFTRATSEGDRDYVLFGQCVIEPRVNGTMNGVLYRTWHLRDCVWAENAELQIDQFHRKWELEFRALVRMAANKKRQMPSQWNVHPDVVKRAEKDPFTKAKLRVIVISAEEYDSFGKDASGAPNKRDAKNFPFVHVVIDQDHETILEETPQPELGYVIPRWVTIGGFSQYAYSPTAVICLPDARMLQQMTLTLLEIGQKLVDPPMIAVGDAILGGTNLYSGAITYVDPDYDERTGEVLRPIQLQMGGFQWGVEYEERIEKVIQECFYLNVLNLPPYEAGDKMTAFEVQARMKEYIQRATPLFEPMDREYNGQLCTSTWRLLERLGAFGSMFDRPPLLRGRKIEFKFKNPLVQAEDERTLMSFQQMSQMLGAAITLDPSLKADVDMDTAWRDAVPGTGAKATWIVDKKKADAIKAQVRQQQAAAQQAQDLGQAGEHMNKMASAVKGVGDAATALQGAGIM